MKTEQPTEAQIKEFWEWCGCHWTGHYWRLWGFDFLHLPAIDPNNLFKYAVPKLIEMEYEVTVRCHEGKWDVSLFAGKKPFVDAYLKDVRDPALALFWAIWEVIK